MAKARNSASARRGEQRGHVAGRARRVGALERNVDLDHLADAAGVLGRKPHGELAETELFGAVLVANELDLVTEDVAVGLQVTKREAPWC